MTDQLPDNNRLALRQVARSCNKASLATLLDGAPYCSLVTVAFDHDLAPILLLSGLSDHTKNIMADPRVSLLLDGTAGHANPQTGPRVTLTGRAERASDPRLTARFLARHPAAAIYAGFADFGIWRVQPERAHFVGGFGRAIWFDTPFGLAPNGVMEAEQELLSIINTTHADALERLGANWRVTALDVDGLDLANHDDFRRMAFRAPVADTAQVLAAAGEVLAPSVL